MKEYLGNDASEEILQKEIIKIIYDSSLPLFRGLIESGRVRITFMDHHEVSGSNDSFLLFHGSNTALQSKLTERSSYFDCMYVRSITYAPATILIAPLEST